MELSYYPGCTLHGTSEVSSAIVASVLTTIVVFLPVVFMRGISGIMYQQLAYVVSFSLVCSLIVALTLIPMLSSRFLRYRPAGECRKPASSLTSSASVTTRRPPKSTSARPSSAVVAADQVRRSA